MNKKLNIFVIALLACLGFAVTSCDDDDDNKLSKATMTSATYLDFDAENAQTAIITVYADAAWSVVEASDWVAVEPAAGVGVTEVRISVGDNYRDGAPDNPRKAKVVFKGATLESMSIVEVRQDGDKFRDLPVIKAAEAEALADEKMSKIENLVVTGKIGEDAVATDGTANIFITYVADGGLDMIAPGDVITLEGTKMTDARKLPYFTADRVTMTDRVSEVTYPEATDITAQLDSYTASTYTYVMATGILDGTTLVVDEATNTLSVVGSGPSVDMNALSGHKVTVKGYYAGTAAPIVRFFAMEAEDLGIFEVVYFADDFEWFEPWSSQTPAGDTIGSNDSDATAQQLGTNKVDDVSTYDALLERGYDIIATHHPDKSERKPQAQTYIQRNYLKFGLTGYQSGIVLPKIEGVPSGAHLLLTFDTCTQRQGSGVFDDTELVVIVETGTARSEFEFPVPHPEKDGAYKWAKAEVDLEGVTVTPDTKITIRNADSQWPSSKALRWYLDNLKLKEK